MTPLMWVCRYGYKQVYTDIIATGCVIDAEDAEGNTALHEACRLSTNKDSQYIRDDLISKGASKLDLLLH